MKHTFDK